MFDRERTGGVGISLATTLLLFTAAPAFAYGGPAGGVEFVGYFMALLTWLGMCFSAVLLWPVYAVIRRVRGRKAPKELPTEHAVATPQEASAPAAGGGPERSGGVG